MTLHAVETATLATGPYPPPGVMIEPQGRVPGDTAVLFEDRPDVETYLALARELFAKDDPVLGFKLICQADALRPMTHEYFMDEVYQPAAASSRPLQGEREGYHFLVLPSLNCASAALHLFLNLHPEIVTAPPHVLDHLGEEVLDEDRRVSLLNNCNGRREGIRWGVVGHTNMPADSPTLGANLSRLVQGDRFVQIVRDPFKAFLSDINHQMLYHEIGYSFYQAGLAWPGFNQGRREGFQVDMGRVMGHAVSTCDRMMYHTLGQGVSRHFPNWLVMDAAELLSDRKHQGMSRLYHLAGADHRYRHPLFEIKINAIHNRVMRENHTVIEFDGIPLRVGLDISPLAVLDYQAVRVEVASMLADEEWESVGLAGETLALTLHQYDYSNLSLDNRRRLTSPEIGQKILGPLSRAWLDNYRIWLRGVEQWLIRDMDRFLADSRLPWDEARSDFEKLLFLFPQLESQWRDSLSLLGV